MAHNVCMPNDNYDITHNPKVREKYPTLHKEVREHDSLIPRNSWYELSDKAFAELQKYVDDDEIGYLR